MRGFQLHIINLGIIQCNVPKSKYGDVCSFLIAPNVLVIKKYLVFNTVNKKYKEAIYMTITHRHPIYSDETSKTEVINKRFYTIYGSIIEKRSHGISDKVVAV